MRRPAILALLAMAAISAALAWGTTRVLLGPEQVQRRLTRLARRSVGSDVELEDVKLRPFSKSRIGRAVLRPRAEGRAAPAAEIQVRRVHLEHALSDLFFRGRYRLLGVEVEEMACRLESPAELLEALAGLPGTGEAAFGEPAVPIEIDRLNVRYTGGPIPLLPTGAADALAFERLELRPAEPPAGLAPATGPAAAHRYELRTRCRVGPTQDVELSGTLDVDQALLDIEVRASNLDLARCELRGLPDAVARAFAALRPNGPIDLFLTVRLPWRDPARATISGYAEAYSVTLAPVGAAQQVTNVSGRIRFVPDGVAFETLRGVYGTAEVLARGRASEGTLDLDIDGRNLDLGRLHEAPLPAPFAEAVRALGLAGRGRAEVSIAGPLAAQAARRFRLEAQAAGASAAGGRLSDLAAQAWFAGEAGGAEPRARGSLRIERALLFGAIPLRGATAAVTVTARAAVVGDIAGRTGGGTLRGRGELGLGPGAGASLDLVARGLDLGDAARKALPPLAALAAAAGPLPERFESGRLSLGRDAAGAGTATVELGAEGGPVRADVTFDADLSLRGMASVGPRKFMLAGTLAAPTATALPGGE